MSSVGPMLGMVTSKGQQEPVAATVLLLLPLSKQKLVGDPAEECSGGGDTALQCAIHDVRREHVLDHHDRGADDARPVAETARLRAQVAGGQSFIFNSIISVVVGGVLLTGGFGSVIGIFFGTITFAIVTQGIYYTDFDRNWSSLIIGVLLLLAVLMNNTFRRAALSYAPKAKGAK